ncbi:MAG: NADPH:quinone oxidoreductase family protein [Cyclobacteriaceae bacterium]
MKAIICNSFGNIDNLKFGEIPTPSICDDEVLIKVSYCGVNFPDTLIVQGKYQFQPDFPFAPGGEVSGTVAALGSKVKNLRIGDEVLAAMGWGGFAEYAVAKHTNTFKIPEGVEQKEASALLETYATAMYALKDRALLQEGETLAVLGGAGGTGTAAIQIANQLEVRTIAVVSTDEKATFCIENGASHAINYHSVDLKAELKSLGGADVIFDPVGGTNSELAFRSLKANGRHLVVGFASGKIPSLPWNLPLLKSASIVGVFWGHFWRNHPNENASNVHLLLDWLKQGKIKPSITKTLFLENGVEALQDIANRKVKGKIVLKV